MLDFFTLPSDIEQLGKAKRAARQQRIHDLEHQLMALHPAARDLVRDLDDLYGQELCAEAEEVLAIVGALLIATDREELWSTLHSLALQRDGIQVENPQQFVRARVPKRVWRVMYGLDG